MVFFGNASGPVAPIDPLLLSQKGSIYLTRPTLNSYTLTREEYMERSNEVMGWIQAGDLDVRIGEEHPLANAAGAQTRLEMPSFTIFTIFFFIFSYLKTKICVFFACFFKKMCKKVKVRYTTCRYIEIQGQTTHSCGCRIRLGHRDL